VNLVYTAHKTGPTTWKAQSDVSRNDQPKLQRRFTSKVIGSLVEQLHIPAMSVRGAGQKITSSSVGNSWATE
jgi:hypothetical protein